ncbi:N/A [soil metagenome]
MSEGWQTFAPYLKAQARGPANLGELDPDFSEEAMDLILAGVASPVQTSGFLLVGRARTESFSEIAAYARATQRFVRSIEPAVGDPVVTVAGSFDGKVRTFNVGAAASLVAAAAGGRVLMIGGQGVPPKFGHTIFDSLNRLGVDAPQTLDEAEDSLRDRSFAATTPQHYLPELHGMLQLRREMVRRTALNVVEKIISPISASPMMIGVTHRPFLETIPKALIELSTDRALVYQAIEGPDEAPLDGNSSLVRVRYGEIEEFTISPESLGLSRATKAHIPWTGPIDEARALRSALEGNDGPVKDLILYNAALRLWMLDDGIPLENCMERARETLGSNTTSSLASGLREAVPA